MKIRKYIVWIVVIGAAVFYGLPVTLLQIPYFQQKVVQTAAGYLEDRIGTNIEIRQVDFRPFNRLILKDVYLEDRQGDTLLYAKRVAAGFEFLPLFQKRFRFGSVQFHSFVLHLSRPAPDAPLNIQYLIDAFRNENAPKGNIDLHINDLSLRKGRVSYRVKTATTTSGRFHPSDLDWRDITGKIRVKHCTNDSLSVVVQRLSAVEQSGLDIRQLAFDLSAGSQKANIRQLTLKLPQSALYLTQIAVNYRRFPPGEHWADSLQFSLHIEPSQIRPEDINALSPVFRRFDRLLEMQGLVAGSLDTLRLTDFLISSDNQFRLAFDATALHLNADDRSRIYMNSRILDSYITVEGIQALANSFSPKPTPLPEPALRLGAVSLQGEVEGLLNQLKATVRLQTEVGNLQADVRFGKDHFPFLAGKLATTGIDVKKLLANDDWGTARFEVNLNTALVNGKDWEGTVEALVGELDYKAYRYENIGFSGDFTANSFKGSLTADSPAGRLAANGSFTLKGKDSQFNFSAEATNLLLDQLHWTKKYRNPKLSFQVDAGFTGDRPDNLAGSLSFRNLVFSNSAGVYSMDTLFVRATDDENQKRLEIRSNLLTGTVDGRFSLPAIAGALEQMASAYLPSLLPAVSSPVVENTDFYWSFTINDTQDLSTVLDLPLTIYEPSQITGEYNYRQNRFRLDGVFPLFKCGALVIENSTVGLTNENDAVELKFDGTQLKRKGVNLLLSARIKALNDSIASSIRWNGDNDSKNRGELDFTTQLSYQEGKYPLSASVRIQPSEMIFNDSIWTLSPTAIDYREGRLRIDGFEARHHRQKINMEGIASGNASDQLRVSLQAVDLDYIFQLLNLPALTFGGIATGYVTAKDLFATRQLTTQLDVQNFSFNNVEFGKLDLHGRWDDDQRGVEMKGHIVQNDTTFIDVDGFIYPKRQELSILFDAHHGNAAFLRKYMNKIAKDFSGEITGKVRLFGHWNDPTVEGTVWVDNGSFGIDFLNTRYSFSDWVRMTPDEISVRNVVLQDAYGNKAIATGSVWHNLFNDFRFSAQASYENFLVFNATSRTNPLFYGKVFGTGAVSLQGTEDVVNIDVSLQNNDNTAITLNFMEQSDVVDYDFINFVTKEKAPPPATSKAPIRRAPTLAKPVSQLDIRTNLLITANSGATLEIVMDPETGDKISGTGNGTLQIQYGSKTPLRVFGNYRIDRGMYNFSFQQAFFRNFEIEEGSSINFRGDPFTANLDIKAAYTASANLGDLDQQLIRQTEDAWRLSVRDNIPVNCVLLLSGPLKQPVIKFDLELPSANAEIERQVKSYIRTDDMMNRQIIYLLLMGRFYTAPEYVRNDTRYNNDLSLLTSTLSSYIFTILGSLSDKFRVDTKFHHTYEEGGTNTEMELLLSSKLLNNRLIINGNFGYIRNPRLSASNDNIPLIGDFDIEYKLTKTGDIRLKGFNRYNYRNYYSQTPEMTQGFGILFRRDFNNVNDLFFRHSRLPLLSLPPAEILTVPAPSDTTKVNTGKSGTSLQ